MSDTISEELTELAGAFLMCLLHRPRKYDWTIGARKEGRETRLLKAALLSLPNLDSHLIAAAMKMCASVE